MSDGGDTRLAEALELMMRIASGERGARGPTTEAGDDLDALILGLNMLAEELEAAETARENAEELLRDEVDAYERAPGLFASADAETLEVLKCNRTLADRLGLSKARVLGNSVLDLHDPGSRAEVERVLHATEVDGVAGSAEVELRVVGADNVIADLDVTRVSSAQGARLRIIWRDITSERRLERQLLQAQKMEAIGRLSGGVAHDFNNLLSVIMSSTALLRADMDRGAPPEVEDLLMIEQAAHRGAALTSDLLAFSRQTVVKPAPTDVREVIDEANRMLLRLIGDDVALVIDTPDEPLVAHIDRSQLLQVLINLAVNGRDAMPDGGTLTLQCRPFTVGTAEAMERIELSTGEYVLIAVTDTGVGMLPEVAAQVFEPFFTTKDPGSGTGLGLSMCYGIVRQAQGRIAVYTEPGTGTTMRVYLPLVNADGVPVEQRSTRPSEGGSEAILLVDDDRSVRNITSRVLERAGYRVLSAANGRAALELVSATELAFDLLVTDVMMPEMGGRELAEALREKNPQLAVLYLSGYTANSIVKKGVLEDDIDFLAKPFTPAGLLSAVRRVLDRE